MKRYSKSALESTIDFLSEHNHHFYRKNDAIRKSLMVAINEAADPSSDGWCNGEYYFSAMGFVISCSEDDGDFIRILVDMNCINSHKRINEHWNASADWITIPEKITGVRLSEFLIEIDGKKFQLQEVK